MEKFLMNRRNLSKVELYDEAIEEEGFFNASEYGGGNSDDAFNLGWAIGSAQLIEELLEFLKK